MSPKLVILILSLLLGMQPITTDLYLPALPALTEAFAAPAPQAQLTLTALLLAFGLSQLVWGPLSDLIGRRKVLLAGLIGYTVASVFSTLAGSIETLVFWRIVQGACMGAGTVCARAIVRDLYAPQEGARAMSKGLSGLGVAACLSPLLGGLITEWLGWRATLATLIMVGLATLYVIARYFKETLHERHADALNSLTLMRTAGQILAHRGFWSFALLCMSSFGGLFCFLSASSYVFIQILQVSPSTYGLLLLSMMALYIKGTVLCRYLILHWGVGRATAIGGALSLAGGVSMLALNLAGLQNVWAIMLPAYLFMIGHGIHQPCGQSGAIAPFPKTAGAASALAGFLMMLVAFVSARVLGANMDGTALPMIIGIAFWSLAVALVAWLLVQRVAPPAPSPAAR